MAIDRTIRGTVTLEFHGALADRFADVGRRRGTRRLVEVNLARSASAPQTVATLLTALVATDERYCFVFAAEAQRLPEHVEIVLNDRVLDLQGGLDAPLKDGDVLSFLPAHAGG